MTRRLTRRTGRRAVTVAVLVAAPAFATPAWATADEPTLGNAVAEVELDAEGRATVALEYVISGAAASNVSFSALDFNGTGDAPFEDLEVTTADGDQLETSAETVDRKTTVTVAVDEPAPSGEETRLTLRYSVPDAGSLDGDRMTANVPLLAFDRPAAAEKPGVFTASLHLPPGHDHVEGFPANPEDVQRSGDRITVTYDTPAMPAVLRSVSTSGDAPLLTLERSVNVALVAVLLGGCAALYFSLSRGRARAAEVAEKANATGSAVGATDRRS